jgi:Listeria-Bacteroides repeat domain (List_Bact_rpt).
MKKTLVIFFIVFLLLACGEIPETFKVIYHADKDTTGFPPTDNNLYKSGDYATVRDQNTLLKSGYKFDGWSTSSDYPNSGLLYEKESKIKIKNTNIFLYAVWSQTSLVIGIE